MLDTAMALIGALGGGALRLVPEFVAVYLHRTDDRTHVKLAEIQLELQSTRERLDAAAGEAQRQRAEIVRRMAQRDAAAAPPEPPAPPAPRADLDADLDAGREPFAAMPAPPAPKRWVEASVTFWLLAIYTGFKAVLMWEASSQHVTAAVLAPLIWGDDDWTIFSGAITYWFIDRTLSTRDARPPSK
jgi:hypothetical protein